MEIPAMLFSKVTKSHLRRLLLVSLILLCLPLAGVGQEPAGQPAQEGANLKPEVREALTALEKTYTGLQTFEQEMVFLSTPGSAAPFMPSVGAVGRLVWAKGNRFREELTVKATRGRIAPDRPGDEDTVMGKWTIVCNGKTVVISREEPSRGHATVSLEGRPEELRNIASAHPLEELGILALSMAHSVLAYPGVVSGFISKLTGDGDVESSVGADASGNKTVRIVVRPGEDNERDSAVQELALVLTIDSRAGVLSKCELRLTTAPPEEEGEEEPGAGQSEVAGTIVCEFRNIKVNHAVTGEPFALPKIPPDSTELDADEVFKMWSKPAVPPLVMSQVGKPLPEMALVDTAGQTIKLSEFQSAIVVIVVCLPGARDMPRAAAALDALDQSVSLQGVRVFLAVDHDAEAAKKLHADLQLSIPVYVAEEKEISAKLPLLRLSNGIFLEECDVRCLVADRGGKVVYDRAGILHTAELRAALRSLGVKPERTR